jgi:hypothetical protein
MRKLSFSVPFIIGITIAFLVSACNNNKTRKATIVSEDGKTTVTIDPNDINTMSQTGDEMTKKMEELKKLPPLTLEQLKALLPEELAGMKRSSFNTNSAMGFAIGEATYKGTEDDKELKLVIWDCAGEAGSSFYGLNYWSQFNMQSENDDGYSKSVPFNGGKAIETYKKGQNEYTLMFTSGDRLLVNIEGQNTGLDVVKQAAQSLNLKTN